MNTTTYVALSEVESVVAEFDPPPVGAMTPSARLHLGRIYQEQRITLTFASADQIEECVAEMTLLAREWRMYERAQRIEHAKQVAS